MSKLIRSITIDTVSSLMNNYYNNAKMPTQGDWRDWGQQVYNLIRQLKEMNFIVVFIIGNEGCGKTQGMAYLEPGTNLWFNLDRKDVPSRKVFDYEGVGKYKLRDVYGSIFKPTPLNQRVKSYPEILDIVRKGIAKKRFAEERVAFMTGHPTTRKGTKGEDITDLNLLGNFSSKFRVLGMGDYTFEALKTDAELNNGYVYQTKGEDSFARTIEGTFQDKDFLDEEKELIPNNFELIRKRIFS